MQRRHRKRLRDLLVARLTRSGTPDELPTSEFRFIGAEGHSANREVLAEIVTGSEHELCSFATRAEAEDLGFRTLQSCGSDEKERSTARLPHSG